MRFVHMKLAVAAKNLAFSQSMAASVALLISLLGSMRASEHNREVQPANPGTERQNIEIKPELHFSGVQIGEKGTYVLEFQMDDPGELSVGAAARLEFEDISMNRRKGVCFERNYFDIVRVPAEQELRNTIHISIKASHTEFRSLIVMLALLEHVQISQAETGGGEYIVRSKYYIGYSDKAFASALKVLGDNNAEKQAAVILPQKLDQIKIQVAIYSMPELVNVSYVILFSQKSCGLFAVESAETSGNTLCISVELLGSVDYESVLRPFLVDAKYILAITKECQCYGLSVDLRLPSDCYAVFKGRDLHEIIEEIKIQFPKSLNLNFSHSTAHSMLFTLANEEAEKVRTIFLFGARSLDCKLTLSIDLETRSELDCKLILTINSETRNANISLEFVDESDLGGAVLAIMEGSSPTVEFHDPRIHFLRSIELEIQEQSRLSCGFGRCWLVVLSKPYKRAYQGVDRLYFLHPNEEALFQVLKEAGEFKLHVMDGWRLSSRITDILFGLDSSSIWFNKRHFEEVISSKSDCYFAIVRGCRFFLLCYDGSRPFELSEAVFDQLSSRSAPNLFKSSFGDGTLYEFFPHPVYSLQYFNIFRGFEITEQYAHPQGARLEDKNKILASVEVFPIGEYSLKLKLSIPENLALKAKIIDLQGKSKITCQIFKAEGVHLKDLGVYEVYGLIVTSRNSEFDVLLDFMGPKNSMLAIFYKFYCKETVSLSIGDMEVAMFFECKIKNTEKLDFISCLSSVSPRLKVDVGSIEGEKSFLCLIFYEYDLTFYYLINHTVGTLIPCKPPKVLSIDSKDSCGLWLKFTSEEHCISGYDKVPIILENDSIILVELGEQISATSKEELMNICKSRKEEYEDIISSWSVKHIKQIEVLDINFESKKLYTNVISSSEFFAGESMPYEISFKSIFPQSDGVCAADLASEWRYGYRYATSSSYSLFNPFVDRRTTFKYVDENESFGEEFFAAAAYFMFCREMEMIIVDDKTLLESTVHRVEIVLKCKPAEILQKHIEFMNPVSYLLHKTDGEEEHLIFSVKDIDDSVADFIKDGNPGKKVIVRHACIGDNVVASVCCKERNAEITVCGSKAVGSLVSIFLSSEAPEPIMFDFGSGALVCKVEKPKEEPPNQQASQE